MNINAIMQQAQKMQKEIEKTKKAFEEKEFSFSNNGGAINLVVKGNKEVVSVTIDKEVIDPEDKEMLEEMLKIAFNEAFSKLDEELSSIMSKASGGMNIPGLF